MAILCAMYVELIAIPNFVRYFVYRVQFYDPRFSGKCTL